MGFGVGIFLLALGAILAFAVHASVSGLDLAVVGWVLMGAGLLGIVLDLVVFAPRRRVHTTTYAEPVAPAYVRRDVY
jgi:hypothetical protein